MLANSPPIIWVTQHGAGEVGGIEYCLQGLSRATHGRMCSPALPNSSVYVNGRNSVSQSKPLGRERMSLICQQAKTTGTSKLPDGFVKEGSIFDQSRGFYSLFKVVGKTECMENLIVPFVEWP